MVNNKSSSSVCSTSSSSSSTQGGGRGTNTHHHHHLRITSGSIRNVLTKSSKSDDAAFPQKHQYYFNDLTYQKVILYGISAFYVIGCGLVSILELFIDIPCDENDTVLDFKNPAYDGSKCPHVRHPILMGMTTTECSFGRRLVSAIMMGGLIGWERRQSDRPAGIRTMSLVSLGSCLFTINSTFAFISGPMTWDASRIAAAIPSGVGFLGAGLIFKKTEDDSTMVVHGLTTAASVWLSAAVGIACGGELYFAASFGTCLMMLLLRFGPRSNEFDDEEEDEDYHDTMDDIETENESLNPLLVHKITEEEPSSLPGLQPQENVLSVRDKASTNAVPNESTPMLLSNNSILSKSKRSSIINSVSSSIRSRKRKSLSKKQASKPSLATTM